MVQSGIDSLPEGTELMAGLERLGGDSDVWHIYSLLL